MPLAMLPVEILIAIVDHLANIDDGMKSSLAVLLRVSRQFNAITLPRLYQELVWPALEESALASFEKFYDTVKTNPGIRFITSYSFLIHQMYIFDQYFNKYFANVLPHLVNVRRLSLALPNYRIIAPQFLWTLPPTAQLTHLTITGLLDWDGFLQFTASCPTLEFVVIETEQTGRRTLTNSKLPNLRSLDTDAANLCLFEDMHSLVNLSTSGIWSAITVDHVLRNFPALRTLWLHGAGRHVAIALVPQYPNLDYLALGLDSVPKTPDTTWLSRSKLKYIHFGEAHDLDPFNGTLKIFDAVKSLVFFECCCIRNCKDGSTSIVDPFIENKGWKGWWEAVDRISIIQV
ncbi:hypothetical protein EYR40_009164 [Pleurotus pulmonarius]|nr:hypothetical protein EYR40_009164 [Pleurotus pulmonarius]